jgi:hypothetical protein
MSTLALVLVLTSSVLHALWNLLIKRAGQSTGVVWVWLVSTMSGLVFAPVAVGVMILQRPSLGWEELFFIGGSALLHIAYHLMLTGGYRSGDLSLVYPWRAARDQCYRLPRPSCSSRSSRAGWL